MGGPLLKQAQQDNRRLSSRSRQARGWDIKGEALG